MIIKISAINNKDLKELSYIEGVVEELNTPKTNTVIIVDNCNKKFYIHTKNIKEFEIQVGNFVVIHYADNSPIRGKMYEIVNLKLNEKVIYTLKQYKKSNNPDLFLGLFVGFSFLFSGFIITGIVFIIREKPIKDVRKYVLDNKDKYGLTTEQAEQVISQYEGNESND